MTEHQLNRRLVLLTGAALGLAGCQTWPDISAPPAGARLTADAHAHLFNAADLPIVNFVRFVAVREAFGELSAPVQALVDLFLRVVQPFAISATAELRAERAVRKSALDVSPDAFAQRAADRTLEALGGDVGKGLWEAPERAALADSYLVVSAVVIAGFGAPSASLDLKSAPSPAEAREALRQAYRALAEAALSGEPPPSGLVGFEKRAAPAEVLLLKAALDPQTVAQTIKWGFLMLQSRTSHLRYLLERIAAPDARTRLLVNLLVDYDYWLQDGPRQPGSSHLEQLELWAAARTHYETRVDLRTFAGYCPLKHAHERRAGGAAHFDALKQAHADGKIAGLKFYPPMGFRAWGNARLKTEERDPFVGVDGVRRRVLDAWERGGGQDLGQSLDDALDETYRWCVAEKVPILAHAGPSLSPAKGWEQRANPAYWAEAVARHEGLHVTLGHLVHDAREFIGGMANGGVGDMWAFQATRQLIGDRNGRQSTVFVDLGYTNEIMGPDAAAEGLPKAFFLALKAYCDRWDPDFSQVLYGSDWIMLGREPANLGYLQMMRDGMVAADWTPQAIENVCEKNLKRFLRMP